ncbi:uncharacterized protein LOC133532796 [Cydia pomonella]|uniref:uncharacterized protein LOC133532796 n=1 Tax=Cydia pomonella TaxID=82600 RepID=UPI002ADE4B9F|nr:uncharacterized protein LOC133532796 [Cydia pomonella]
MLWFLKVIFLCGVKTIFCESIDHINQSDKREVNKFLGKILQADKFDELADRIADRAVRKLNDFQKTTVIGKFVPDDEIYRSRTNPALKSRLTHKHSHKHGKIDVDAVLKKAHLPLDGLKLRYKHLKNKHSKATSQNENEEYVNTDQIGGSVRDDYEMKISKETNPHSHNKIAQDEPLSFHEYVKHRNENFMNPFGIEQTISWNKKSPKHPPKDESDTSDGLGNESKSGEKDENLTKTTRTEGDKQFVLEDHPDYKEYNEQLANMENLDGPEKVFL